jgi:nitrate/nitrite transport system permease protein
MSTATSLKTEAEAQPALMDKVLEFSSNATKVIVMPLVGIIVFLLLWTAAAQSVKTSLGQFPGPASVLEQFGSLYQEHTTEREKASAFYTRQDERNEQRMADDPEYQPRIRDYTGKETFLDQIITSLITVMSGFIAAALIAIPLGIAVGLNKTLNAAVNPIIQIFKPVSPLAWLPLVTMLVSATYVSDDPWIAKSFLNSMITVTLCCIWPMVINTSVGVASIDDDLLNVSKVLRLPALKHVQKIVVPASIPMIFTGMRMSLGIAWMVLIAAEMLAQSP